RRDRRAARPPHRRRRPRLSALQRRPQPGADRRDRLPSRARRSPARGRARRGEAAPALRAVHARAGRVLRARALGCEEAKARRVVAVPLLVEDVGVAGVPDPPRAPDLDVLVPVVGRDANAALARGVEEVVVERPDAARGGLAGQLDLGVMAVMVAEGARLAAERFAQESHDRVDAGEAVRAAAVVDGRVRGEAPRHLVPQLQVETAEVAMLELLDRLEVLERADATLEVADV